ncbi:MAG: alpha/beta fold hydrolase [Thermomicrobiales bacterium]
MKQHVLFIHGAGEGAYAADKQLAESLQQSLGSGYDVHCPALPDEGNAPYEQWTRHIRQDLATLPGPVMLSGHSIGACILMKWLSENAVQPPLAGIFLLATPFWGGDGWLYDGYEELELPVGFATRLPQSTPLFLYHGRDDEVVPFAHLALYADRLPQATVRALDGRGHQFNNDLSDVAADIMSVRDRQQALAQR